MKEKRIQDLMTLIDQKFVIQVQDSLVTAITVLGQSISQKGVAGIVVIDTCQKPVGLLTFQEIIKAISPKTLPADKYYGGWNISGFLVKPLLWEGLFTQRLKEEMNSPVHYWMKTINEVSVKDDETLISAAEKFTNSGSNLLFVLHGDNPVGLISSDSLICEMCDLIDIPLSQSVELTG
ncbi:hypothetical protein JCM14036_19740 [Desulfotomaculum defluvii]